MPTEFEKARHEASGFVSWVTGADGTMGLGPAQYRYRLEPMAEATKVLLSATEPVPPGELAEAVAECDEMADDKDDIGYPEEAAAIRTVLRALRRRQAEQPMPGEVVVPLKSIRETTLRCHRQEELDRETLDGHDR